MSTFLIAWRERRRVAPNRSGVNSGRAAPGRSPRCTPPPPASSRRRSQPADIPIDQLAPVVQRHAEHGVARALGGERPVVDESEPVMPGLDHQAALAQVDHGMLGAAEDARHRRPFRPRTSRRRVTPRRTSSWLSEARPKLATHQGGAQVANDGFDFGELGHRAQI